MFNHIEKKIMDSQQRKNLPKITLNLSSLMKKKRLAKQAVGSKKTTGVVNLEKMAKFWKGFHCATKKLMEKSKILVSSDKQDL